MAKKKRGKFLSPGNILWLTLVLTVSGAAVAAQLRLPPEERTWYGNIAGIPYDFRMPTIEKLRATFWNKDNPQILVPQAFGVGWTVNLYPLLHLPQHETKLPNKPGGPDGQSLSAAAPEE